MLSRGARVMLPYIMWHMTLGRKKLRRKKQRRKKLIRLLLFAGVATVWLGSGTILALSMPKPPAESVYNVTFPKDTLRDSAALNKAVRAFENRQHRLNVKVVSDTVLKDMLAQINLDAANSDFGAARQDIKQ